MKTLQFFLTLSVVTLFTWSCSDDDAPIPPNQEELITTLQLVLTPTTGSPVTFTFQDLDGDGGNPPVITNGTLAANTNYSGAITVSDESQTPAEDITPEVSAEDEDHQFFFAVSSANLTVVYNDQDANGNPLGLDTTWDTGDASTGNLTITLRHEPNKSGAGVSAGDITNAGGETDIEVNFDVTIN